MTGRPSWMPTSSGATWPMARPFGPFADDEERCARLRAGGATGLLMGDVRMVSRSTVRPGSPNRATIWVSVKGPMSRRDHRPGGVGGGAGSAPPGDGLGSPVTRSQTCGENWMKTAENHDSQSNRMARPMITTSAPPMTSMVCPWLEQRSGDGGRPVGGHREHQERDAQAQRVGDEQRGGLGAGADRGQREDGAQRGPDAGGPADREHGAQDETAGDAPSRSAGSERHESVERPPAAREASDTEHAHEVEAEDDEQDAAELAHERQVLAERRHRGRERQAQEREHACRSRARTRWRWGGPPSRGLLPTKAGDGDRSVPADHRALPTTRRGGDQAGAGCGGTAAAIATAAATTDASPLRATTAPSCPR